MDDEISDSMLVEPLAEAVSLHSPTFLLGKFKRTSSMDIPDIVRGDVGSIVVMKCNLRSFNMVTQGTAIIMYGGRSINM